MALLSALAGWARLFSDAFVDARRNFWGDKRGPTHPENPAGWGDTVVDADSGGMGEVEFRPFLKHPVRTKLDCADPYRRAHW